MTGLLKFCWMLSIVVAALAWPAALALDAMATEALIITGAKSEQDVEVNRAIETLDPKAPDYELKVAGLYGTPTSQGKGRYLFVPEERYLRPKELPSLRLLTVDKQKGENPLQVQTVHFFAQWLNLGAMAAFAVFLAAWIWRRKRGARPAPPPSELPSDRAGEKA